VNQGRKKRRKEEKKKRRKEEKKKRRKEGRKEDIDGSKVAGSDDEHEAVFQRGTAEMSWICMNDVCVIHIQFIARISTIVGYRI
jgi:hypothetical protein